MEKTKKTQGTVVVEEDGGSVEGIKQTKQKQKQQ